MGELRPTRVDGHAHDLGQLAGAQELPEPARLDRQIGRRNDDPLGGGLAPLPGSRVQDGLDLRQCSGRQPARLAANARGAGTLLRQGGGEDAGDPHRRPAGPAGQQQLQGLQGRGRQARLQGVSHRADGDQFRPGRRSRRLPSDGVSASRAASGARSGRRSTPRSRRARRRETWRSAPSRMSRRSSTTPRGR